MGLRWWTALRAPGPPDREARDGGSKEGNDRAEDLGTNQAIGSMACLMVGARRAVPLRPHLEHSFHALLAVAFEEEQLLVAVDREGAWHRRSERDLHRLPGPDFLPDCKARLGIINDEIVRHQYGHALDGQFDRLTGLHDEVARAELIAVGFDHGPLDSVRVHWKFEGSRIRGCARDGWHKDEQTGSDSESVQHCPGPSLTL